jgi:hypothetical protein
MKPHNSVRVVRKWCDMHTDPILRCFDNSEGLNNGDLLSCHDSQIHELANGLRLGTAVPSHDLSGAWVTVSG